MKVKICGIKYPENLGDIIRLEPDMLGFIFYEASRRCMRLTIAPSDLLGISDHIVKTGVFVNEDHSSLMQLVRDYRLDAIQLHGDDTVDAIRSLKAQLPVACMVIKAFGVDPDFDWTILKDYQDCCDVFLFDTKTPNYGGSGRQFDHKALKNYDLTTPFLLSGGIGPDELDAVLSLEINTMAGIDLNSKLETKTGWKDVDLVRRVIQKIRTPKNEHDE